MAFIDRAVEGFYGEEFETLNEALLEAVDLWCSMPDLATTRLPTYLGMTQEEYETCAANPCAIIGIVDQRRREAE